MAHMVFDSLLFFPSSFNLNSIGFAIARRLAKDGCKVMISSRKEANVNKALEELRSDPDIAESVQGVTCHVGKPGDREKLVHETVSSFGGLDFLVSNAAVNPTFGSALDVSQTSVLS